ncbi:hypothetical protein [Geothrix sp. 21YS21S-2]|uniref:hypothetical protein n=1 Tax=Geothrix sp. 21YS21S-2 TaxID=3068893 RepID=UPI0027BAD4B2|nr:hypothetical protein [Geothrix sp. 21YS21S-2]
MKHIPNLKTYEGGSGTAYSLFLFPPGVILPDYPGIFVVTCTWWHTGAPGELLVSQVNMVGQSWCLSQVIPCYKSSCLWIPPNALWEIAFLEIDQVAEREKYSADLQAGLASVCIRAA